MLLTLKVKCVSIIIDYIATVVKETKVDGGYYRIIKNGKLAWSDSSGKK